MAVEGWGEVSLSAVATGITKGTTPTTFGYDYQLEGINFFRVENITLDGKLSLTDLKYIDDMAHNALLRSQLQNGDILISIAGALGRSAIVREDHLPANINQAIAIVRLSDTSVDHDFIRHAISGPMVQAQIKNVQAGLAQSNLNLQQVGELKIDIPPLLEQKKIVEILGSVDEAIARTEAVISQTQKVKQGLLQTLLTKGIGHTKFKQTEIGEIPICWSVVKISDIAIINKHSLPSSTAPDFKIKYLDIAGIPEAGRIEKCSDITYGAAPSRARRIVKSGDILVSTVRPYLRAFAYIEEAPDNLIASTGYAVITTGKKASARFLYQIILSNRFLAYLTSKMKGSNYPAVTAGDVGAALIALPPQAEQESIAEILNNFDLSHAKDKLILKHLRELKSGLMSDLLSGRVRVKMDNNNCNLPVIINFLIRQQF